MTVARDRQRVAAVQEVAAAALRWRRMRAAAWPTTPYHEPSTPAVSRAAELEARAELDRAIDALEALL